jgi:uncharacterized membrane protein HdeD (DUF308 family)
MLDILTRNWWVYALRGVVAIIFGVLALALPGTTILALVLVFGVYALFDGVLAVVAAFRIRKVVDQWWVVLLEGLAGILVGIIALVYPNVAAAVLCCS